MSLWKKVLNTANQMNINSIGEPEKIWNSIETSSFREYINNTKL